MVSENDYHGGSVPPLSLWQLIQIIPYLVLLPFAVVIGVFHENRGRSWSRAMRIAALRYILRARAWTPWELRSALGMTTAQAYAAWARKNQAEVLTDELPDGARLHWVGPRMEDRVLLYFHSGGYVLSAIENHFVMLASLQKACKGGVGVALLNYSLVPENPFPTQLRQATVAVLHLLDKGTPPSNIVIAGDSAGGNLALQLASLLLHSHPSLPPPPMPRAMSSSNLEPQQSFGGLLLISPCVEFCTDAPSFKRNDSRDVVPLRTYQMFVDAARPSITRMLRSYYEPGLAPHGWWMGLGRVFPRILITAGEHEGLIDQIRPASEAISEEVRDTTVFVLPGGMHGDFIEAFSSGEGERGDDYKLVVSWLLKTLKL